MSTSGNSVPFDSRLSSFVVYPAMIWFDMFDPICEFNSPMYDRAFSLMAYPEFWKLIEFRLSRRLPSVPRAFEFEIGTSDLDSRSE